MTERTQPGEPEQHHDEQHRETPEEFVEEAEVAAWQTVEEVKDLAHDAAEKVRRIVHRDNDRAPHNRD